MRMKSCCPSSLMSSRPICPRRRKSTVVWQPWYLGTVLRRQQVEDPVPRVVLAPVWGAVEAALAPRDLTISTARAPPSRLPWGPVSVLPLGGGTKENNWTAQPVLCDSVSRMNLFVFSASRRVNGRKCDVLLLWRRFGSVAAHTHWHHVCRPWAGRRWWRGDHW